MGARKIVSLHPTLTERQGAILASRSNFLLLTGPAGTAKTYTGLARGLQLLFREKVDKVIILRSAVATRDIGFLPGSLEEKIEAFEGPYYDLVADLVPGKNAYRELQSKREIEFHSTSFLRGVTFDRAYILLDEFQNLCGPELETVVTRIGVGSHLCVCGDSGQPDLPVHQRGEHRRVIETLAAMPDFESHDFPISEIVRSDFVRRYFETKQRLELDHREGPRVAA